MLDNSIWPNEKPPTRHDDVMHLLYYLVLQNWHQKVFPTSFMEDLL